MTIPLITPQTRTQQIRTLSREPYTGYRWLMAVRAPAISYPNVRTLDRYVWVPGVYPTGCAPYLPVTTSDPRKDFMLSLMTDFFEAGAGATEIAPVLVQAKWLDRLAPDLRVYEFPLYPETFACPVCGEVYLAGLDEFVRNGCTACGTAVGEGQKWGRVR